MAAPAPIPNYAALLNTFFLREYVAQFASPRLTADEQLGARMKLEYELDRITALQPSTAVYLLRELQAALTTASPTDELWAVVEWFLGFNLTKSKEWQREIDTDLFARYWRRLADRQAREPIIEGILRIDFSTNATIPWASRICTLFRQEGISESGDFTEKGTELVLQLLRELFVAPAHADALLLGHTISLSRFAGEVLRYCLAEKGVELPRRAREAVLGLVEGPNAGLRNLLAEIFDTVR